MALLTAPQVAIHTDLVSGVKASPSPFSRVQNSASPTFRHRNRLQAKLFGGARTAQCLSGAGSANARFAKEFLVRESIPVVAASLGGETGRRDQNEF